MINVEEFISEAFSKENVEQALAMGVPQHVIDAAIERMRRELSRPLRPSEYTMSEQDIERLKALFGGDND